MIDVGARDPNLHPFEEEEEERMNECSSRNCIDYCVMRRRTKGDRTASDPQKADAGAITAIGKD